jgi:hypothetical protein
MKIQTLADMTYRHFSNPQNHLDQDKKHISKKEFESFME